MDSLAPRDARGSRDRAIAIAIGALLWVVMQLPYLQAWLRPPRDCTFVGITRVPLDQAHYFSWIHEAADGHLLVSARTDPRARARVFFHPLFVPMGWLAGALGAAPVLVYHAARMLLEGAVLVALWRLAGMVVPEERLFGFVLAAGGGGLEPWLSHVNRVTGASLESADLDVAENSLFAAVQLLPHFGAALLLMMGTLLSMYRRSHGVAALLLLLLGLTHVFDAVTMGVTLGIWCLVERRPRALLALCGLVPPALYYVYLIRWAPGYREFGEQNVTLSPSPARYALGLAVPLALAALAVVRGIPWSPATRLLLVWAVTSAGLLYAPLQVQRRFHLGLSIPLSLLGAAALARLPHRRVVAALALLLSLPSSMAWVARDARDLRTQIRPAFVGTAERAALRWLRENADPDDVLLSGPATWAPAMVLTGQRAYCLHPVTTQDYPRRRAEVLAFYQAGGTRARPSPEIAWVYWGRAERALSGRERAPELLEGAAPAYRDRGIHIWRFAATTAPPHAQP